ncbi:MAG: ferritin [Flavobacterium sp.]|nr:ferritin [Flavobacterium sp.]
MISSKMQDALNKQMNVEFFSSYLYLSMAAYFESVNLLGAAKWMKLQSKEEYDHATKFFGYLTEVGARVTLDKMEKPKAEWTSVLNVYEESLAHEMMITDNINKLADLALSEKDHATGLFLGWFIKEQVEEVGAVQIIIEKYKMLGDSKVSLYMLDKELGKRV